MATLAQALVQAHGTTARELAQAADRADTTRHDGEGWSIWLFRDGSELTITANTTHYTREEDLI